MLGDLTEVPVPTKFLFLLLGPSGFNLKIYHFCFCFICNYKITTKMFTGHSHQFKEIGRAVCFITFVFETYFKIPI